MRHILRRISTSTNKLPHILDGDAFQLVTRTYEAGCCIHFVKFGNVLVNDGANVDGIMILPFYRVKQYSIPITQM